MDPISESISLNEQLRKVQAKNNRAFQPDIGGATRVERHIVKSAPNASGLKLLAEQREWDLSHSKDPSDVSQGPYWGAPPHLPRFVTILLAILGAAGLIFLLKSLSWLLAPTFLALNLVIAVYPVQSSLRRHGWPSWLAVLLTALTLLALISAIVVMGIWAVTSVVNEAPQYAKAVVGVYNDIYQWLINQGLDEQTLRKLYNEFDPKSLLGALPTLFSGVSGLVSLVTVVASMLIMMMIDVGGWANRIAIAGASHPRIVAAMRMFSGGIRKYWLVSSGFGLVMATLNYIELRIVSAPLPFVWAMLTFFTTFIPSVGFFFAMVPPVLVTGLMLDWKSALILLAMYLVTTWVVQGVFQPLMTGDAVGVNATVALVSLLFWAWVFGPLGALIALPCTLLTKALLVDADPKARWVNSFISNKAEVRGAASQS